MNKKISHIKLLIKIVLLITIFSSLVFGQNVTFVSSIDSDLYAPTFLELYDGGLAVLETYTSELKEFSPDGVISQKVHFQSKASALARIADNQYLISVSDQKKIILVDLNNGEQSDFLNEDDGLRNPIDLLIVNEIIYVLDAGHRSILKFNNNGHPLGNIRLEDESQQPLNSITSFDYNPGLHQFYLLDQVKSMVHIISADGNYLGSFGSFGVDDGEFTRGGEIKLSPSGHVLVSDRYQGKVAIFDHTGKYVEHITGNESDARSLSIPTGIDVDENGVVYISSSMRPGIDIYHVNFEALGKKLVVTGQYFPDDLAELKSDEIQLIAYARGENINNSITGFFFEIYDEPGLNTLIDNSEIVPPEIINDSIPNNELATGTWVPDNNLTEGQTYYWRSRVQMTDTISNWTASRSFTVVGIPGTFQLYQNYPNPFNPTTTISFTLPEEMDVSLEIFNILGQRILILENRVFEAGLQKVIWDGKDDSGGEVVSGVYFYRLQAEGYSENKKMVLIK